MSHYLRNVPFQYEKGGTQLHRKPREKLLELSDLSHFLLGADTMEELMENAAHHIVEILGVDFCKIVLLESNQHFYTRAAFYRSYIVVHNHSNLPEAKAAERLFGKVLKERQRTAFRSSDSALSVEEHLALGLNTVSRVNVIPLQVEESDIGIMMLGDGLGYRLDFQKDDTLFLIELITDQLSSAIYRSRLNQRLENLSLEAVLALSKTLETRDHYSGIHSKDIAGLAEKLAVKMGCDEETTRQISWAALLHDIGKIGIEDHILRKPGPLTDDEWGVMKTHPTAGAQIVTEISGLEPLAPLIESHHERLDGKGYPNHLKGDAIPLGSKIISVVDTYCAITEGRVYRSARSHEDAVQELIKGEGKAYDPDIVAAFLSIFESKN